MRYFADHDRHTPRVISIQTIADGSDADRWNRFVASASGSTFCHRAEWKQIMSGVLGHECLYLAAVDQHGEVRGVPSPGCRVRSVLGHYLISLPFLNDGGPIGDAEAQQSLVEHAVAEAKQSGASLLELRSRVDVPGPLTLSYRRVAVHLSLPSSKEELWNDTLRPKLRAQIRRPGKEGMTFRCGAGELDGFYEAVCAEHARPRNTGTAARVLRASASSFGPVDAFCRRIQQHRCGGGRACCLHWRDELEVM